MRILLAGGGSGGSVSPLLAVAEALKRQRPSAKFLLVGTKTGPEQLMAEKTGIDFVAIPVAKYRRYFSLKNALAPFFLLIGFLKARKVIAEFKPNCVFGAGSFVQVPVIWAAYVAKIPVVIHQQDLLPSLANKLCRFCASKITVSFPGSERNFSQSGGFFYKRNNDKIICTGNPFRENLLLGTRQGGLSYFKLKPDLPTLLVLGGGTGSQFINNLIISCLPKLTKSFQIIHATGAGKTTFVNMENYHAYEFISNMADAYAVADIVLARAGMSTITELSNLKKLSIIVPMPDSHQEYNAKVLAIAQAAIVLDQKRMTPLGLSEMLRKLLFERSLAEHMKQQIGKLMPHNSAKEISHLIVKLIDINAKI